MTNSINHLKYTFEFDSAQVNNLTYSFDEDDATWGGVYDENGNNVNYFSSKEAISGQSIFTDLIELWDNYSAFDISSTTGKGDINVYKTNQSPNIQA